MATASDAELVLKLYDLRREETLRKARHFMAFNFNPQTVDELLALTRAMGTEENTHWRQATSYWEMAASLVLHGTLDPDLFFDTNGEGLFLLAKVDHLRTEYKEKTGNVLMRQTSALVEKYPAAASRYEGIVKMMQARRAAAKA